MKEQFKQHATSIGLSVTEPTHANPLYDFVNARVLDPQTGAQLLCFSWFAGATEIDVTWDLIGVPHRARIALNQFLALDVARIQLFVEHHASMTITYQNFAQQISYATREYVPCLLSGTHEEIMLEGCPTPVDFTSDFHAKQ